MSSTPLKSLLGGLVLLASPLALADSTTTIPAFDAKIATARTATSPGGSTIIRQEMRDALGTFLADDGTVDAAERAYLGPKLSDASFLTGVTGTAKKYLTDFHELNDAATTAAPLNLSWTGSTPEELFGASGALSSGADVVEGYIPNGMGVANQYTLGATLEGMQGFKVGSVGNFDPITLRELVDTLSQTAGYDYGTPTPDEVDGAAALITQISRNSNRLYVADWSCPGRVCYGDMGGYLVAAVSTDRRFVRVVKIVTWRE